MKKRRILSALLATVTAATTLVGASVATAAESPYKDVKTGRWSFNEIMYATENGYMNGKGGGLFAPEETMSRAMVVTVLYRFQGEPRVNYIARFKDVKKNDWFANAVMWAAEREIVNGVEAGKFAPNEDVTRQQLAAMLVRYAPMEYIKDDSRKDITGYKDYKKVQAYARDAMSWANATGLITGVTTTTLEPTSGATREQFAVILKRFREGENFDYELNYSSPKYSTALDRSVELVTDADIYVAVDGKDTNPGTLSKPVATFARAKELVRELKKTASDEIVVAFKAGNYGALEGLTFTAEDSGTADVPIRYTAYGDGKVLFENGITIKNEEFLPLDEADRSLFVKEKCDDIYKVDLNGKIDSLEEGNMLSGSDYGICDEARTPNKNSSNRYYKRMSELVEPFSSIKLTGALPRQLSKFKSLEGLKVCGHIRRGYLIDELPVKSFDASTGVVTFDFDKVSFEGTFPLSEGNPIRYCDDIYFQNLPEMLDDEGEYWYNPSSNILYVYDPSGDYTISDGDTFIKLNEGVRHISFVGLDFSGSSKNAIVSDGESITIDRCSFSAIRGLLVLEFSKAKNITVTNCEIYNFANCAILLREASDIKLLKSGNTVIENNYFHDFGRARFFLEAEAISLYDTVDAKLAHNVFVNGEHGGIELNECIGTIMEYNVFDNLICNTGGFGAVYMWNGECYRDNTVRYCLFLNIGKGTNMDSYGIYVDNFTSGMKIYGNIFYNAGSHAVCFHEGRDNELHDNICINNDEQDFLMYTNGLYNFLVNREEKTDEQIMEEVRDTEFWHYYGYQRTVIPAEGEDGYELWNERWPIIYRYTYDLDKIGELESVFTVVNYVNDNAIIGSELAQPDGSYDSSLNRFGKFEGNKEYKVTDNPFFENPTLGDYTVKSSDGVINDEYVSHMNQIGLK